MTMPSCYGASQAASNGAASNGAASSGTVSNGAVSNRAGRPARLLLRGAGVVRGQAGDIARAALVLTHFEHGDIT
jgi:hypothetical protein